MYPFAVLSQVCLILLRLVWTVLEWFYWKLEKNDILELNYSDNKSEKASFTKDLDKLSFNFEDDLSGISNIDNISITIDDNPVLFEFNPYRKEVFYIFEEDLLEGKHNMQIEVKDNVGNTTITNGDFYIKWKK